ncbi:MAG: hypothetical protein COV74_04125 [Candidatus Omnitrophica bacterium CG11_big_fil_rev_8_21_14_0_20_45_26]|uniref:Dihydrofolate reductase n=1 Tax=Candidatus Abzuiibacterium crystallinum TaxID=1974748 RepID=A0A2H0LQ80_9BACT|nr:MAG: hypothetical protein COV74_04125 [Candidatus Omnitrophica bacterium CG11_big_fil_rev_8_21_14_0_20_45_26]PIW64000.1 MAG: hypothetical protein COW12_08855 [Candidatus Omnitrophica bacterium CG12_big_fil_rev_8_21_14_0_65_45_16]
MLYHAVAMAQNRVIGKANQLPWHFSSDLKHFKQMTLGHTILMGRKTFESIGKPLSGRENFVISRTAHEDGEHLRFFTSVESALDEVSTRDCYIIGGAHLYEQTMQLIDGIYLTYIHADFEGDVFYPSIPPEFEERTRHKIQEEPLLEVVFYENTKHMLHQIE